MTSCQAFHVANKNVISGFRLQMLTPPLRIFLTPVGRKCLSSATSIREGLMNDDPVLSCIYVKVTESYGLVILYHLMVVTAPLNPLSYATILRLTSCLSESLINFI